MIEIPESTTFARQLNETVRGRTIHRSRRWGKQDQVNWGRAKAYIHGRLTEVSLFCLRMKASLVPFVWAAPTERLETFLEGHKRAFEWLGGIPASLVYDNPKTAVTKARILSIN